MVKRRRRLLRRLSVYIVQPVANQLEPLYGRRIVRETSFRFVNACWPCYHHWPGWRRPHTVSRRRAIVYRLCRWACGSHGLCREKTTSGQVYDANDINRPEKMSISNVNKLITPLDRDGKPPVPISRLLHVCGSASTNGRVHSPHMSSCHRLLGCIALHSLCIEAGRSIAGWTVYL